MNAIKLAEDDEQMTTEQDPAASLLPLLLGSRPAPSLGADRPALVVGELIAIDNQGRTPLVLYPGQSGEAAMPARSIVDLHGDHIGRQVVLVFTGPGDDRPIILGVLRDDPGTPRLGPDHYEVQADGERLIVAAREQLVLRCGLASITLTKEGKVLIQGTYLSSRSSGVHRIKGGSVQIN